jgi:hypothetical protein
VLCVLVYDVVVLALVIDTFSHPNFAHFFEPSAPDNRGLLEIG